MIAKRYDYKHNILKVQDDFNQINQLAQSCTFGGGAVFFFLNSKPLLELGIDLFNKD